MGPKRQPQPPRAPPAAASADADSIFREYPHIDLRASGNREEMAMNYASMIRRFLTEIEAQSARENGGQAEFLLQEAQDPRVRLKYLPTLPVPEFQHSFPVLPKSGLVVLVLRPDEDWPFQRGVDGQPLRDATGELVRRPLKFLFSLNNLYLLGYLDANRNRWILFSDVELNGLIPGPDINRFTLKVQYDSSYGRTGMKVVFHRVQVGYNRLRWLYRVLSSSGRVYTQAEIQDALAMIAVMCSEATRRKSVCGWMIVLFIRGLQQYIDPAPARTHEALSAGSSSTSTSAAPATEQASSASSSCISTSAIGAEKAQPGSFKFPKENREEPKQPSSAKFHSWKTDCVELRSRLSLILESDMSDENRAKLLKEMKECYLQDLSAVLRCAPNH